tara:strand:- start:847 stop:1251 length:405 start_codon:yes stop_codon:yes gene_type:complete
VEIQKTEKLQEIVEGLKSENKEKTLENVFNYVQIKYGESKGYKLFILLNRHFYTDVEKFVNKEQYLPCHVQSLTLKTLLINTGQFQEEDFEKKIIMMHFGIIHTYYIVTVDDKRFKADTYYGILDKLEINNSNP